MPQKPVHITCFSDILCVWAWVNERRMDEVRMRFGDRIDIDYCFINLFGNTAEKINAAWQERGGFEGYARHVSKVASRFDHIALSTDVWRKVRPASSLAPHLFLKAASLDEPETIGGLASHVRNAFFAEGRNIASRDVLFSLLEERGLPRAGVESHISDGSAFAALSSDLRRQQDQRIEGSPTLLLNNGRQKLYGNVGFRIIEANIQELLKEPVSGEASWC